MNRSVQPHILIADGEIPPVVLVCGDPARAKKICNLMDTSQKIACHREYHTFVGSYQRQTIAVTSHGVGAPGAAICFEELIKSGARAIIRLGTCGSLQENLKQGDLILVSAAVREDGVSQLLIPVGYPAVASTEVITAIGQASLKNDVDSKKGIVLSTDLFYPGILSPTLETYQRAGVLGVEMECSALLIIGNLKGILTGALLTIDGNPLKWEQGDYDPAGPKVTAGKNKMLRIGLDTAAILSREMANTNVR